MGTVESEAGEAPQRAVGAMCEANWPTTRPTEAPRGATWRGPAVIRGLDKSKFRAGHFAMLATPPVLSDTHLKDPSCIEAQQAAPKEPATHGLEGAPLREEHVASQRRSGRIIESAGDVVAHCKDSLFASHTQVS